MSEYKTKQKEILLECLNENKDIHMTASDILVYLRAKGHTVGMSTVYRQLDKLAAGGYVRKYIIDESSPACYQYIGGTVDCTEHFHLKCNVCNKLIHTDCSMMKKISEHLLESHGFAVDSSKTLLYGVCEDCAKKNDDKMPAKGEK